jgi:hypothetical protein
MSQTRTYVRTNHPGVPARKFDHAYDPVYTVSDSNDFNRAKAAAAFSVQNIVRAV